MKIKEIELFFYDYYKYLPNVKHTVLSLSEAQAEESENVIRFKKGIMTYSNGEIENFRNNEKILKLSFEGSRPLRVKVIKAWVDKMDEKVNLELEVIRETELSMV